MPIGYESTMSPYRPMYSAAYAWLYTQTGAATGTATWHCARLDVVAGVTLGYNTFFELRGDGPSYITRALYWWNEEKKTRLVGTAYTGPQPIATAKGHVAEWQTVIEAQVVHDWSPRFTQAFEMNVGWTSTPRPPTEPRNGSAGIPSPSSICTGNGTSICGPSFSRIQTGPNRHRGELLGSSASASTTCRAPG